MPELAGQIALVTGASRGIGRAVALAFAAAGADIGFCHLDDPATAAATEAEIAACRAPQDMSAGARVLARRVDVADLPALRAFAAEVARRLGPIDILVNNAGMNIRRRFEDYAEAEFDRLLDVHLRATFFLAQAVYPAMCARGSGCIINIASQQALTGSAGAVPYSAAKAGILGFTRALAREAAPRGVRVNAIAPGPIETDLLAGNSEQWRTAFRARLPAGRFGRPDEIAATALLLAGPSGGFYVGACLSPNGGDVMH